VTSCVVMQGGTNRAVHLFANWSPKERGATWVKTASFTAFVRFPFVPILCLLGFQLLVISSNGWIVTNIRIWSGGTGILACNNDLVHWVQKVNWWEYFPRQYLESKYYRSCKTLSQLCRCCPTWSFFIVMCHLFFITWQTQSKAQWFQSWMINIVYGNIYFESVAPSTIFNKIFIA